MRLLSRLTILACAVAVAGTLVALPLTVDAAKLRTWTRDDGIFTIEAKFVRLETNAKEQIVVVLLKADGKQVSVPLDTLSEEDQKYVEKERQRAINPDADEEPDESNAETKGSEEKPDAVAEKEDPSVQLLTRMNLVRNGDFWIAWEEDQLANHELRLRRCRDDWQAAEALVDKRQQKAADKAMAELDRRKNEVDDFARIYSLVSTSEEYDKRRTAWREYEAMVKEKFADVLSAKSRTVSTKRALVSTLRKMDRCIAAAERKYRALAKEPAVLAAIAELGHSLGPQESFAEIQAEFDALADQHLSLERLASRDADLMDCGPSPTSDDLPSARDEPAAFLQALGLNAQGENWSSRCEENMIRDAQAASELAIQQTIAQTVASKSQRRKLSQAKHEKERLSKLVDAEYDRARKGLNGTFRSSSDKQSRYRRWAELKLKELALERKIRVQDRRIHVAESRISHISRERQQLLESALEKAKRIQAHYDTLSQDESVKTALEKVSGALLPTHEFGQQRRKAKSALKKMAAAERANK